MTHSPDVTLEDVRHVAELANLELTEDEEARMLRDLNAILRQVGELSEVDTTDVAPMAAGIPEAFVSKEDSRDSLREDKLRPSLDRATVMAEAPDSDGRFFKVPKVIER